MARSALNILALKKIKHLKNKCQAIDKNLVLAWQLLFKQPKASGKQLPSIDLQSKYLPNAVPKDPQVNGKRLGLDH